MNHHHQNDIKVMHLSTYKMEMFEEMIYSACTLHTQTVNMKHYVENRE